MRDATENGDPYEGFPYRVALFPWRGASISQGYAFAVDAISAAERAVQPIVIPTRVGRETRRTKHRPSFATAIVFAKGEDGHIGRYDADWVDK